MISTTNTRLEEVFRKLTEGIAHLNTISPMGEEPYFHCPLCNDRGYTLETRNAPRYQYPTLYSKPCTECQLGLLIWQREQELAMKIMNRRRGGGVFVNQRLGQRGTWQQAALPPGPEDDADATPWIENEAIREDGDGWEEDQWQAES